MQLGLCQNAENKPRRIRSGPSASLSVDLVMVSFVVFLPTNKGPAHSWRLFIICSCPHLTHTHTIHITYANFHILVYLYDFLSHSQPHAWLEQIQ